MSDVNILPPLLTRIGLNENDIKIYTTVLGLGKATIGEIMVITQLDALSTVKRCNILSREKETVWW